MKTHTLKKHKRLATIADVDERVEKLAVMTAQEFAAVHAKMDAGFAEVHRTIQESEERLAHTLEERLTSRLSDVIDAKFTEHLKPLREDIGRLDARVTVLEKRQSA